MSQYHNVWFINFCGIGNGVVITPILQCFEKSQPSVNYYHTENQLLSDPWFVKKAGLKSLKGFSSATWRRFKEEDLEAINSFIKEKGIDLIVNLRNEGPRYDTGYYQFKEKALNKKIHPDFCDLDFNIIEQRIRHQNLTNDIIALFKEHGVNVSNHNPKWLKTIRKYENKSKNVGFGMAANQTNKRWTTAKWTELANKIITNSRQNVILFSGKSEEEIKEAKHVLNIIGQERCKLVSNLSLKDVTLQIKELQCFVSNDTGLLHIAVAMNIPTIGLYISTNSEIWSPYDKTNFVACQNSFMSKCTDTKPHCGNCFHYYDICPAIAQYGDDIVPDKIYKIITKFLDRDLSGLTYKNSLPILSNKLIENYNIIPNIKEEKIMVRKRILLAQNFFRDGLLITSIVANSSINKKDIVYEIGPGEGIITKELAERAGKVVAIEKDAILATQLRKKFNNKTNIQIYEADFLKHKIKDKEYKIFSNIPFNITAEVVKRIIFRENPPSETYLIIQKEAAEKFSGIPNETEVSVLSKPWFAFEILRKFNKTDFEPIPSVDVVLLHIARREQPLVSSVNARNYQKFVQFGFIAWKKDLKTAYNKVFTYEQWKHLSKNLSFSIKATPTELSFKQWLGLFEYFLIGVIDSKKTVILSK